MKNAFFLLTIFISYGYCAAATFQEDQVRKDFPIFNQSKPVIYFDSAATTQKPKCVIDTLSDFYLKEYATVHRGLYNLSLEATNRYHNARKIIQDFLHANSEGEIVFTKGTTDSINLIATSLSKGYFQPQDEIIISEMEHHSNIVPWQMIAQEKNLILKIIPINDDAELDMPAFQRLLSNKTKLVSIAHVANATGTVNPIETIIKKAHEKKALVLIDGAQAIAHIPVDVQKLDVDFYVFSGHKIYGPTGIGVLYGKKKILHTMPPIQGGGDMIRKVTLQRSTYQKPPVRFEAGTPPFAEAIALAKAIEYFHQFDQKLVQKHEKKLLSYAREQLQAFPNITLIGNAKNTSGIISFLVQDIPPFQLSYLLNEKGICLRAGCHCAQPVMQHFHIKGTNRISFGIYNTQKEIDSFIIALKQCMEEYPELQKDVSLMKKLIEEENALE